MFAGRSFGLLAAASFAGLALSSDPALAGRHSGPSCGPSRSVCAPRSGWNSGCSSGWSIGVGFSTGSVYGSGYYGSGYYGFGSCYRPYRPVCRPYPVCAPRWSYAGCSTIYSPTVIYTVPAYRTQLAVVDSSWADTSPVVVADSNAAYRQWQTQQSVQTYRNPDPQPAVAAAPAPAPAPTVAAQPTQQPSPQPVAAATGDQEGLSAAWALVAQGDSAAALTRFARLCDGNLGWAPPRAGYSVAAALEGKTETAAWGFRRAFAEGGDSLGFLPDTPGLDARLSDLSSRLRAQTSTQSGDAAGETWFVVAGIDYLRHDVKAASEASQKAQLLGQNHQSFRNLLALLD